MTNENDIKIDIKSHPYLGDVLDGIRWNGNKEDSRPFTDAFTEVLRTCGLTGRAKLIIRQRFLKLYKKYKDRFFYTSMFFNIGRITITVGTIIIPALITLDNEISERSAASQAIYYTTFSISVIISITNGLGELMQLSKKYYTYASAKEYLTSEGWSFLSLSGKYKHCSDHAECWRKFIANIETYNSHATLSDLILSVQKSEESMNQQFAFSPLNLKTQMNIQDTLGGVSVDNADEDSEYIIYTSH